MVWPRPHHLQITGKALYGGFTKSVAFNIAIKAVNGMRQMQDLSTYTAGENGALEIEVPNGDTIKKKTPIVLEVISFSPSSSTEINA